MISGTSAGNGITKSGSSNLTLSGANTYAGTTTLSAGTLQLGNVNALQNTSAIALAAATTMQPTISSVAVAAAITTATGTVTIGAPTNNNLSQAWNEFILNGAIGGTGNVTFNSALNANGIQTVTLNAAGTYSGTTLLDTSGGTGSQIIVKLGVNNALPTTTVVTIDGHIGTGSGRVAEINMNGFSQTLAGLTNTARTSRVQRVVNPDSAAAATLTINDSSDWTFTGYLGSGNAPASFSLNASASNGGSGSNFGLIKSGNGTFTLKPATVTMSSTTYSGNSYTGGTTVSGGALNFSGFTAQPASGALAISGGATINLSSLGAATATTPTVGVTGAGTLNVILSGGYTKANTCNYDMSGFTGIMDISGSGGRLLMQSPFVSPAVAATIRVEDGTTAYLGFSGSTTLNCTMELYGADDGENLGQLRVENNDAQNGPVILKANSSIGGNSGMGYIGGGIIDGGLGHGFAKVGTGTLTLSAANTYTGPTTLTDGTLSVESTANLGAAGANLVFNGGTLQITGTTLTSFSGIGHTVSFTTDMNVNLDIANAANTFTVDQALNQGKGWFYKYGPGTAILNQVNTMMPSGGTNYNAVAEGTLLITKVAAMPGIAADLWYAETGATLAVRADDFPTNGEFTSSDLDSLLGGGGTTDAFAAGSYLGIEVVGADGFSYANDLAGTSSDPVANAAKGLVKLGTGTLTLSGANTYSGPTAVTAGTLALGASTTLPGTTAVSIGNATLDAATFTNTTGTLGVTGGATINLGTGATLAFADSSAISWSGTLALTGTFVPGVSLRFGTTSSGLTSAQLALITGLGGVSLDANGYLIVDPYNSWSGGAAFTADANGDGVANGLAWILGADSLSANGQAVLPTPGTETGFLTLHFKRVHDLGPAKLHLEYSNDLNTLDAWHVIDLVAGPLGDIVVVDVPGSPNDDVTVKIPTTTHASADGKLFARLHATEN